MQGCRRVIEGGSRNRDVFGLIFKQLVRVGLHSNDKKDTVLHFREIRITLEKLKLQYLLRGCENMVL